MTAARWIDLAGAVNVRDLGGLPTADGQHVLPRRLIRADNLQGLTAADVRRLVEEYQVRSIADLRTATELELEGPGPMTREPRVRIEHLSVVPESGVTTDVAAEREDGSPVLPWQTEQAAQRRRELGDGIENIYAGYLVDGGEAVLGALRLIASTDGAVLVHCAAGKDRTGVVVAAALAEVGVTREAIVGDYARSGERIGAIFGRLKQSPTYAGEVEDGPLDRHKPRAESMRRLLNLLDKRYGGVPGWLRVNGWSDDDAAALRRHLLG